MKKMVQLYSLLEFLDCLDFTIRNTEFQGWIVSPKHSILILNTANGENPNGE
jgi:hypothetical protein